MMQSLLRDPMSAVGHYNEIRVAAADVLRMLKAFAGIQVSARRGEPQMVHLESGQAFLSDGWRLHTVPVNYQSHVGIDIPWREIKELSSRGVTDIQVQPNFSEEFFKWKHLIPQADLGVLCETKVWLPKLAELKERGKGWVWGVLKFEERFSVLVSAQNNLGDEPVLLPHLMYKGKRGVNGIPRALNLNHLYDVFRNADELGDQRLFLCMLTLNPSAPVLLRGNSSALTALLLPRK